METVNNPFVADYYLFIDTEATGLNYDRVGKENKNLLLEVAYILTDSNFSILSKDTVTVGRTQKKIEPLMNQTVADMHYTNGLLNDVYNSSMSVSDVDDYLYSQITEITGEDVRLVPVGNNIQFDTEIVRRELPELYSVLDYKLLDISSIRRFFEHLTNVDITTSMPKTYKHRAMDDIEESYKELMNYYKCVKGFEYTS